MTSARKGWGWHTAPASPADLPPSLGSPLEARDDPFLCQNAITQKHSRIAPTCRAGTHIGGEGGRGGRLSMRFP